MKLICNHEDLLQLVEKRLSDDVRKIDVDIKLHYSEDKNGYRITLRTVGNENCIVIAKDGLGYCGEKIAEFERNVKTTKLISGVVGMINNFVKQNKNL